MRYRPDHKFHAHCELAVVAARLAKQAGFAATPLRRFMSAVGRSTGAFYALYENKDDLLHAIVDSESHRTLSFFQSDDCPGLLAELATYLQLSHVDDSAGGCLLPALAPEIGRARHTTRLTCEKGLLRLHTRFAHALGDPDAAWAAISQAVGTILLARTMATESHRKEILTSSLKQLCHHHRTPPPAPPTRAD